VVPPEGDVRYAEARMGREFFRYYSRLPVYLIDPPLMDIVYPPERKVFLVEECAEVVVREFDGREKDEEDWWDIEDVFERWREEMDRLWARLRDCLMPSEMVAMGVYFSSVPRQVVETVKGHCGVTIGMGPTIFICPERVKENSEEVLDCKSKSWAFRFGFASILIHELAHAFMDGGKSCSEPWERFVEESLANAYAFYKLSVVGGSFKDREASAFLREVAPQPLEYQGWEPFVQNGPSHLRTMALAWRRRELTAHSTKGPFHGLFEHLWDPASSLQTPFAPFFWFPFIDRPLTHHLRHIYEELCFHLPHPWDRIWRDVWLRRIPLHRALRRMPDLSDKFWCSLGTFILRRVLNKG